MSDFELQVDAPGKCSLSGVLSFETVPQLVTLGSQMFAGTEDVKVDLSGVGHSDSAGLALLVSWVRTARLQNKSITFLNPPSQLQGLARVGGVEQILPFE